MERAKASASDKEPTLVLKCEKGVDIKTITIDDFEMRDYEPMEPQLKFELGIWAFCQPGRNFDFLLIWHVWRC